MNSLVRKHEDGEKPKAPRNIRPREPIAINAATVSQLTSEAILGIPGRRYLEIIIPKCRGVASVGNLRVVSVDEVRRVLRELAAEDETAPVGGDVGPSLTQLDAHRRKKSLGAPDAVSDAQPETPDEFFALAKSARRVKR